MKKPAIILIAIFLPVVFASCTVNKLSKKGVPEKKIVTDLLDMFVGSFTPDAAKMMKFISPKYIAENKLDLKFLQVNTYSPEGYKVLSYDSETGTIKTEIWGEDKEWVHALVFKVVMENKKLYLYPGRYSKSFIDPWFKVQAYIQK